jgi:hypothetical protein
MRVAEITRATCVVPPVDAASASAPAVAETNSDAPIVRAAP